MVGFTNVGLEARAAALDAAHAALDALPEPAAGRDSVFQSIAAARGYLSLGSVRQAHGALRDATALLEREGRPNANLVRLIEAAHKAK